MNAFNPPPTKPQLVVNLFGGPCAGKSTLAAILFGRLKGEHFEAELPLNSPRTWRWRTGAMR